MDLALKGIKAAKTHCNFQGWACEEPKHVEGPLKPELAGELQVLQVVETHSSFSHAQNPRTKQFLSYISGGQYKSISRKQFSKTLAALYEECQLKSIELARTSPGTLCFDGQYSQGLNMENIWLTNASGRIHVGTADFSFKTQDGPQMATWAAEAVQRIGADHIAAIITDRPSVMVKARRLFMQQPGMQSIAWGFCMEHGGHLLAKRIMKIIPWCRTTAKD